MRRESLNRKFRAVPVGWPLPVAARTSRRRQTSPYGRSQAGTCDLDRSEAISQNNVFPILPDSLGARCCFCYI